MPKYHVETVNLTDLALGLSILSAELDRVKLKTKRKHLEIDNAILEVESLNHRRVELELSVKALQRAIS